MSPLDIAVAGAGTIGRTHIELIQASDACRLAAIVDPAAAAAELARAAGVPRYETLQSLFSAQRPDGVIVATPNRLHVENGLDCIAAGVPALIEKPLADSVDEALRLCAAAERAAAKILVGHHRLHSPLLASACAIVQ